MLQNYEILLKVSRNHKTAECMQVPWVAQIRFWRGVFGGIGHRSPKVQIEGEACTLGEQDTTVYADFRWLFLTINLVE